MGTLSDIVTFQMLQPMQGATTKPLIPIKLPEPAGNNTPLPPNPGQNFNQAFQEVANAPQKPVVPTSTAAQTGIAAGNAANNASDVASLNAAAANSGLPEPVQSDITTKTNIAPATKQVDQFFNQLGVHSYQYKNKKHGEGTHFSVMAQELEKAGPVGKSMVIETSEGKKVDYGRGLAVFLAGLTNHNKRIKELERLQRIKGRK